MIETLKHLFGTCGESHINLITATLFFVLLNTIIKQTKKQCNE